MEATKRKRTLTWNTGRPAKGCTEVYHIDAFNDKYKFVVAKVRVDGVEHYLLTRSLLKAKMLDYTTIGHYDVRLDAINAAEDNLK